MSDSSESAGGRLPVGLTSWRHLPRVAGPVLLVVDAPPAEAGLAGLALDALAEWAGEPAVHAIAPSAWEPFLAARGLTGERVVFARDEQGREVEFAHFLHTPLALPWITRRNFVALMGVQPHSPDNVDVHEVIERQLCLLVGEGRVIGHTLPREDVYLFDAPTLVWRLGRRHRVAHHASSVRRLLDDLHDQWCRAGAALTADRGAAAAAGEPGPGADLLGLRDEVVTWLGDIRRQYLERDAHRAALEQTLAELHAERDEAVRIRDQRLVDAVAERNEAVDVRERRIAEIVAERNAAVDLRDAMLAEERARYARTLDARLRRAAGKVLRTLKGA